MYGQSPEANHRIKEQGFLWTIFVFPMMDSSFLK
jgi:hypothetical protein